MSLIAHPAVRNFAWLVADKGVRLVVALGVGSWVARYLGAADFGLFAYVGALIAIVAGAASLGMDALVVREIIRRPADAPRLVGTAMLARALTAVLGTGLMIVYAVVARPESPQLMLLVAILGGGVAVQALESGELWYQAHVEMRRLVLPRLLWLLVINALKIVFVLRGASLVTFVTLSAIEWAGGGVLTYGLLRWGDARMGAPAPDSGLARALLRECWPLALSGLTVVLYMRISQLLLAGLLDDAALGVYAAATRITEAANFLPTVLASSLLPSLLRRQQAGDEVYRQARLRFFRLNVALALLIAVPLTVGAPEIIALLYGHQFAGAAPVLMVHAWTLLFAYLGVARGQHLLNERQTQWALRFTVWGLAANVGLSLLLIPRMGATGAAWATVLAYGIASVGTSFFYAPTRAVGREQVFALLTPWRLMTRMTPPP